MLRRLRGHHAIVKQYGLRRCLFRLFHDVKRRTGWLKRTFPAWSWQDRPLAAWLSDGVPSSPEQFRRHHEQNAGKFFFPLGRPVSPPAEWLAGARAEAAALREGTLRYFSALEGQVGFPEVDWFLNPFTHQRDSAEEHWCDRGDFLPGVGDVKVIWEPARFSWAYALARAYAGDPRDEYAEMFWGAFESWLAANPPERGPNWQCGQEMAIRVLACVFALHVFWGSAATSPARVAAMAVLLAASAEHIERHIDFARAQMGNHATSEAAGLYTVGTAFPELAGSARWRELGRRVLDDEARQFNWTDGSYTQHSTNYQRLMLHAYLWCLRLGELNGEPFRERTRRRLRLSYEFLYQLQDAPTGRTPNYGPNDGALLLPLSGSDYLDYRPVLGAMHYLFHRTLLYEVGPWAEDLLWLFGQAATDAPRDRVARTSRDFPVGGYHTLRGEHTWAMVRCHSYRNRPNQADMLHLDLWCSGVNVLRDSGSFSYYDPRDGWNEYFVATAAHNTVVVGGADQMVKGPRFRWFSLLRSRFVGHVRQDELELWEGEHYGYRRLACGATHRRAVCRIGDAYWLVVDDVLGRGSERVELYWHLPDVATREVGQGVRWDVEDRHGALAVACSSDGMSIRLAKGQDDGERAGWQSLYYGRRTAAPTIRAAARGELPVRFVTLVALDAAADPARCDPLSAVEWTDRGGEGQWSAELAPPGGEQMVRAICRPNGQRWDAAGSLGADSRRGELLVGPGGSADGAADVAVAAAEVEHLDGMADAHVAAFPGQFLTLMGRGFLRCFYRFYVAQPGGIALVAVEPATGRVAGLVVGGEPALRGRFLRRHLLRFLATALPRAFVHGRVRRRLAEHLGDALGKIGRKLRLLSPERRPPEPPEDPPGTWSNLLSVCTRPEFRGRGVGTALMEAFRAESRRRGYRSLRLSVHNDNEAAIALYKKAGWQAILTTPRGTYFKRSVEDEA